MHTHTHTDTHMNTYTHTHTHRAILLLFAACLQWVRVYAGGYVWTCINIDAWISNMYMLLLYFLNLNSLSPLQSYHQAIPTAHMSKVLQQAHHHITLAASHEQGTTASTPSHHSGCLPWARYYSKHTITSLWLPPMSKVLQQAHHHITLAASHEQGTTASTPSHHSGCLPWARYYSKHTITSLWLPPMSKVLQQAHHHITLAASLLLSPCLSTFTCQWTWLQPSTHHVNNTKKQRRVNSYRSNLQTLYLLLQLPVHSENISNITGVRQWDMNIPSIQWDMNWWKYQHHWYHTVRHENINITGIT